VGAGSVTFLQSVGIPQVCKPKQPLTYLNLQGQRMSGGGSFDLRNWAGYGGATVPFTVSAEAGVLLTR
jgi:hypothetical protein